ncbi:MAG: hypothetical protein WC341_12995 [Bacteroidales bacterium]|jgi:hypothetical protein
MKTNINGRLLIFINALDTSIRQIEIILGFSNGYLGKLKKGGSIGSDKLEKIATYYKQLNPSWLLRNEGEMLLSEIPKKDASNSKLRSKLQKEIEELKKDKAILADQIILKDQQIKRLWKEIDELKGHQ